MGLFIVLILATGSHVGAQDFNLNLEEIKLERSTPQKLIPEQQIKEGYEYQPVSPIMGSINPIHVTLGEDVSIHASNGPFGKYFIRPAQLKPLQNIDGSRIFEQACCITEYESMVEKIDLQPNAGFSHVLKTPRFQINSEGTFSTVIDIYVSPSY